MARLNWAEGMGKNTNAPEYEVGSAEQRAVWAELDNGNRNVVVGALAGTGKTFTGVEWCKRRVGERVGFVAFNKHIERELSARLAGTNTECKTYHGLGYAVIKGAVGGRVGIDQYKVDGILDRMEVNGRDEWAKKKVKMKIRQMVGLAKQYCARAERELFEIADRHDVDLDGIEGQVIGMVPRVLDKCKSELRTVDFDDMVWLPKELGLVSKRYDTLLIDEAQDTNLAQQWLAVNATDRLVVIGDKNQAIYAFRGSDSASMGRLYSEMDRSARGVVELPLTVTRRCPKSHVRLAQVIVPTITGLENSPEGVVGEFSRDKAVDSMAPGDLVVCRVNKELVGVAYRLLKRGVKAVVRGRDIGQGLVKLLDRAVKYVGRDYSDNVSAVISAASEVTRADVEKYMSMPHGKGEGRAAAAEDRMDCLVSLCGDARTVMELRKVIEVVFADFTEDGKPNNAVVLGTVHRTKGLESERVWVLAPELLMHSMAKKEHEVQQERNIVYIACTRAKMELNFVGKIPEILKGGRG